ncbi:hypothetical protein ACU4GD_26060 [Cupriavidus basilensis]
MELAAAKEDLTMMRQIRDPAPPAGGGWRSLPRYELIKADTELLGAQKTLQSAQLRVNQAKAALRQQVGGALPAAYSLAGSLNQAPALPALPVLRDALTGTNAELTQRRLEADRASLAVDYQRSLRLPELAVRAGAERQPDNTVSQVGLVLTIPLWGPPRRPGEGEATAQAIQAAPRWRRASSACAGAGVGLPAIRDHAGAGERAGRRHRAPGRVPRSRWPSRPIASASAASWITSMPSACCARAQRPDRRAVRIAGGHHPDREAAVERARAGRAPTAPFAPSAPTESR